MPAWCGDPRTEAGTVTQPVIEHAQADSAVRAPPHMREHHQSVPGVDSNTANTKLARILGPLDLVSALDAFSGERPGVQVVINRGVASLKQERQQELGLLHDGIRPSVFIHPEFPCPDQCGIGVHAMNIIQFQEADDEARPHDPLLRSTGAIRY
jgi:hypothetical protein